MKKIKVALIGSPNVGKSTIYNYLTKSEEHTGNWAGKTVLFTSNECVMEDTSYIIYDLPGTYSLISRSKEEMVTTDFVFKGDFDVAVVVVDATSLEKGISLALQTREIFKKVVVAVNLIDEAQKKGIKIDYQLLEQNLGVPVVKMSAKEKIGFEELLLAIKKVEEQDYLKIDYGILNKEIKLVSKEIKNTNKNKEWIALRILENNLHYINLFQEENLIDLGNETKRAKENLENVDISLEIVIKLMKEVKLRLKNVVRYEEVRNKDRGRMIDKILTHKFWGILIMLSFLFILFYITIVGANYPSSLMFNFFSFLEGKIFNLLNLLKLPSWIVDLLVNGIYKTLYWVVSVMLPPMMIFFPLFSFLEDLGVLPRIAFNMDKAFSKCDACGKQALTMCMGIGCNAVGVTGARIIDAKRERIMAILTNVFVPCNGKFPTLIAVITMFLVGLSKAYGGVICALILTGLILLGILITFIVNKILSLTLLKGEAASFTLELPPYRMPNIKDTIIYSVKNRALFVLKRAVGVAIPAGIVIWFLANTYISGSTILSYASNFLEPIGHFLGVDGVVILGLLLGFPANEIVIPVILMAYLKQNTLTDFSNLAELKNILLLNGWTIKTAVSFICLMMFHYPCSTTMLTIKKETNSFLYTFLAFIIPVIVGVTLCLIIKLF